MEAESLEELFKSEVEGHTCSECGQPVVSKGVAAKVGNEMHPHKGPAKGKAPSVRGGKKTPIVDREHAGNTPVTRTGRGAKKGEGEEETEEPSGIVPLFPMRKSFRAVEYVGGTDSMLAKSIEGGSSLHAGSLRNLAMEQETQRLAKAEAQEPEDEDSPGGGEDDGEAE